jgi:hypothetical protein
VAEFGGGMKDGAVDTGKGLGQLGCDVFWGSSPFADEQTRAETRARAQARKYAVTHPEQLAEAIVAPYQQDLAAGRDGHAAGRAAFEAITVIGAGSLSKAGTSSYRCRGRVNQRNRSGSFAAAESELSRRRVASATGGVLKANKGGYDHHSQRQQRDRVRNVGVAASTTTVSAFQARRHTR